MPNFLEAAERMYKRLSGSSTAANPSSSASSKVPTVYSKRNIVQPTVVSVASVGPEEGGSNSSPYLWAEQNNYSARALSSSNLAYSDDLDKVLEDSRLVNISDSAKKVDSLISPRGPPPGDLTAVSSSSDSEGIDELDTDNDTYDDPDGPLDEDGFAPREAQRRSQRLRRSLQKAQANLESRIKVPSNTDLRYISEDRPQFSDTEESSEDTDEQPVPGDCRENYTDEIIEDGADEEDSRTKAQSAFIQRTGVQWPSNLPLSLVDLMPKMRCALGPQTTQFARAFCQRSNCRCLLRGHDTLMFFPISDIIMCEATWEKILDNHASGNSRSGGGHFLSRLHGHSTQPTVTSESIADLIMFRQCRGWYEVLNENHEAAPHWTTTEELRRAQPTVFLVRQQLRCLVAPQSLWLPPLLPSNPNTNDAGPPPIPAPSKIISEAIQPNVIASSTFTILKPGTLLSYIDYLPMCSIKRGKKTKQISLVLAVEKQNRLSHSSQASSALRKLYYLGTEEASAQAVFPQKLSLSHIAGFENITGVHMLGNMLRKFRLPISIRPVAVPEKRSSPLGGGNSLGSDLDIVDYATAQSTKPVNIFPSVPGITFTERNFIRLRRQQRGDIIIVAPIDAPDRLFVITPTLLQDHLFQVGFSEDTLYHRLAAGHRQRTIQFLSTAHPQKSLNYLLRFLKDVTSEPASASLNTKLGSVVRRLAPGLKQNYEISSLLARAVFKETGRDPRVGPDCSFSPDQVDQVYEDLDDLYFFTRNGYFPAKNRQRRIPQRSETIVESTATLGRLGATPLHATTVQRPIPKAEHLLAASLNINVPK